MSRVSQYEFKICINLHTPLSTLLNPIAVFISLLTCISFSSLKLINASNTHFSDSHRNHSKVIFVQRKPCSNSVSVIAFRLLSAFPDNKHHLVAVARFNLTSSLFYIISLSRSVNCGIAQYAVKSDNIREHRINNPYLSLAE